MVNEILQIRREQGGLLDGTLLEKLSGAPTESSGQTSDARDDDFIRALRGVAAASSARPTPSRGNLLMEKPGAATPLSQNGSDDRPSPPPSDENLIALLRSTARRLDGQSADFEDVDAYRAAARCRSTAHQLRRLARDLKGHPARVIPSPRLESPEARADRE